MPANEDFLSVREQVLVKIDSGHLPQIFCDIPLVAVAHITDDIALSESCSFVNSESCSFVNSIKSTPFLVFVSFCFYKSKKSVDFFYSSISDTLLGTVSDQNKIFQVLFATIQTCFNRF